MDRLETILRLSDWQGRNARRFELAFPVRLRYPEGSGNREIEAVSKNISVSGLLVRSVLPIPERTPVTFVISVHGDTAVRPIHLEGEGEVVRLEGVDNATFTIAVKCRAPVTQLEEYLQTTTA